MPEKQYIGLISAVQFEARLLLKELTDIRKSSPSITTGRIGNNRIVHITSNIGIANAAHAVTILLERFSPRFVLLFGIGGAYPSCGLEVGDIALAEKEIYADTGVLMKDGFHSMEAIEIPMLKRGRKKYFNEFPLDKTLIRRVIGTSGTGSTAVNIKSGVFLTVSQSTGTRKRAEELGRKYNAVCENMEGAAVAHICARYGVPVLELRGISNIAGDRDMSRWNKKSAAENCQKAVIGSMAELATA